MYKDSQRGAACLGPSEFRHQDYPSHWSDNISNWKPSSVNWVCWYPGAGASRLLYLPALRLGVLRPNLSHRKDLHQDRINAFSVENIWLSEKSLNKLAWRLSQHSLPKGVEVTICALPSSRSGLLWWPVLFSSPLLPRESGCPFRSSIFGSLFYLESSLQKCLWSAESNERQCGTFVRELKCYHLLWPLKPLHLLRSLTCLEFNITFVREIQHHQRLWLYIMSRQLLLS